MSNVRSWRKALLGGLYWLWIMMRLVEKAVTRLSKSLYLKALGLSILAGTHS
jgi:hypothetical protein